MHDSRAQRRWEAHTGARAKMRERQFARMDEEKKLADLQLEELRRRKEELAARQLIRQDKLLKQEAKHNEELLRRKALDEKHERNLLVDEQD